MPRYFYWYRSMLGRWSPCIADQLPGPGAQTRAPKIAFPAIKLEGEDENLTLMQAMEKWPVPPEEPPELAPAPVDPTPPVLTDGAQENPSTIKEENGQEVESPSYTAPD